ncbi:GPP34 family phosphoprotein [Frankia sp. AiPa1]|uniref:GOLPH3/VPS74 family protein n=1 Tax=Frankia sp. AiPa1 TaxID=573492 RepID=UPI00202B06CB|nr:GPP34 family phosphoprotein [Frankia sp. AiPa1]MCL9760904.1 GPP34 family phosphoprotein [Frankia sp. AiPa1]
MEVTTAEKFLLLTLDDAGADTAGLGSEFGLAAALVSDLVAAGHLVFDAENQALSPGQTSPDKAADAPLASAYDVVTGHGAPMAVDAALARIVQASAGLPGAVGVRLVDAGVLGDTTARVLGLIRVRRHPVLDPAPGRATREELLGALGVITQVSSAEPGPAPGVSRASGPASEAAVLLAVLRPFGWIKQVTTKEQRPAAQARATEIVAAAALPRALGAAVEAARTRRVVLAASTATISAAT